MTPVSDQALAERVVALADQCVKCGLCQPHCPTYRVARNEAESPRGRIALARALALGMADEGNTATQHLNQCLACLRCEHVCPSQVGYGELIVDARALLRRRSAPGDLSARVRASPRLLRAVLRLANAGAIRRALRHPVLRGAWRALGLLRAIDELPELARAEFAAPRTRAADRGRVGLLLGCVASVADRDVHAGARRLLAALGYEVVSPAAADCCGALPLHAGDVERAEALGRALRHHAEALGVDTLLVSASGCFGTLRDRALAGSRVRVREIHEFLAADARLAQLTFRALPQRLLLHTPCTQASVAGASGAIRALLQRIPQVEIVSLPAEPGCCGAAGDYFLRHPPIADALRDATLAPLAAGAAHGLVTSNVGCRLFLGNGLRARGATLPVLHPVALLARQLEN